MTIQELTDLVARGEGLHVEFKRKLPEWDKLVREIVAFANTEGGFLLIGVDDDGTMCGVRDAQEVEEAFALNVSAYVHPPVPCHVSTVALSPKRAVVVVDVPPSPDRPHRALERPFFSDSNVGHVLVRIADSSVRASKEMAEVIRFSAKPRSVKVELGEKELLLLRSLGGSKKTSMVEFSRLAGIPLQAASRTLVHMVKGGLLKIEPQVNGEDLYFLVNG